jgi:hypothetical protein
MQPDQDLEIDLVWRDLSKKSLVTAADFETFVSYVASVVTSFEKRRYRVGLLIQQDNQETRIEDEELWEFLSTVAYESWTNR